MGWEVVATTAGAATTGPRGRGLRLSCHLLCCVVMVVVRQRRRQPLRVLAASVRDVLVRGRAVGRGAPAGVPGRTRRLVQWTITFDDRVVGLNPGWQPSVRVWPAGVEHGDGPPGWTQAEDGTLTRLYQAGAAMSDIAGTPNRSDLGLYRPAPRRRWSTSEEAALRDGYDSGLACQQIAHQLPGRTGAGATARAPARPRHSRPALDGRREDEPGTRRARTRSRAHPRGAAPACPQAERGNPLVSGQTPMKSTSEAAAG